MTARGAFITIEGGEGVGKTTSLQIIETTLNRHGKDVVTTREPGGTSLGEAVRSWVLDGDHGALSAETEVLLMFAARTHHLQQLIMPALEAGKWVLCDRFTDATMAYQGGGRGADPSLLRHLTRAVQGTLEPDLTLLLDAPVSVGMARIANRPHDHFERENSAFFERVRQTYLELAASAPARIRVIDASAQEAEVSAAIAAETSAFCKRFGMESPG